MLIAVRVYSLPMNIGIPTLCVLGALRHSRFFAITRSRPAQLVAYIQCVPSSTCHFHPGLSFIVIADRAIYSPIDSTTTPPHKTSVTNFMVVPSAGTVNVTSYICIRAYSTLHNHIIAISWLIDRIFVLRQDTIPPSPSPKRVLTSINLNNANRIATKEPAMYHHTQDREYSQSQTQS